MEKPIDSFPFNPAVPNVMHVDFNSCFAAIEQQANIRYRNRPLVVVAYLSDRGCILASSVEAKKMGIKTGMAVFEGKRICPKLLVLPSDPDKYRFVHLALLKILRDYSDEVIPRSIDEFCLKIPFIQQKEDMVILAGKIKNRIKNEIGEVLTVSIGIAPNRYLAKIAAGLKKPDGLEVIDKDNFREIYSNLKLADLCGIKRGNIGRLYRRKILSVKDFFLATSKELRWAFESITGHVWYLRLRGWEVDDFPTSRKSFGNSFVLPRPLVKKEVLPVLQKLTEKTGQRMRQSGYSCSVVGVNFTLDNHVCWGQRKTLSRTIFSSVDIFEELVSLTRSFPEALQVRSVAEWCSSLKKTTYSQGSLFVEEEKERSLTVSLDRINHRFGDFTVMPAAILRIGGFAPDRIAFGKTSEIKGAGLW